MALTDDAPKLADVQWTYRRVFAFSATGVNSFLIGYVIHALMRPELHAMAPTLRVIAVGLLILQALLILAYLMGATATDLSRIALARHTTTTVNRTETGS